MPGGHSPAQPRTVTMTVAQALERAFQHYRARQLDQADAILRGILAANADQPDALHLSGLVAFQAGKHEEGVARVRRALAVYPTLADANYNLASMLRQGGQLAEAREWLERGLVLEGLAVRNAAGRLDLFSLAKSLCDSPLARWSARRGQIGEYGGLLERAEDAKQGRRDLAKFLGEQDLLRRSAPDEAFARITALLGLLGFSKISQPGWTRALFDELTLPWMKEALALGHYDLALKLEVKVYDAYVKQTETEQHFRDCFSQWVPAMREAGRRAGAGLGPVSWPDRIGAPVVGFFLHFTSLIAHVEVLLNMLEGWTGLDAKPFIPRVYVLTGNYPPMVERFAKLGVPVVLLEQSCAEAGQDRHRRLLCLRERCAEDRVTALVWVSAAITMSFGFALRLAPVQIWWAMKYHSLEFEEIDGYMTIGAFKEFTTYNNRPWRVGHTVYLSPAPPDAEDKARAIRTQYARFEVILGSLGREEKIDSPDFLEALAQILRANPNACYLWTGRKALPSIQLKLEELGIAERCFFAGWVPIPVYAWVLDVFLDTFPFPCATTGLETMAAGKPLLMYLSPEAMETGIPMMIKPVFDGEAGNTEQQRDVRAIFTAPNGESLFLLAVNAAQYVAYANRLIQDPDFRALAGEAARVFVQRYMQNRQLMAESFSRHLREIIGEKRPH